MKKVGRIIRIISNQYTVEAESLKYICTARGKFRNSKLSPVVGDMVELDLETLTIDKILERKNYLDRPVVANVDVALIVTSMKKPDLSLVLLDKLISIVSMNKIEPMICFTKLDLLEKEEVKEFKKLMKYYESIGIKIVTNKDKTKIWKLLKDKVAVVTGQTGAGKSTLLNKLDKNLNLETKPISEALNRGVHTTRHVELYEIGHCYIVDTPGFSALDLKNVTVEQLRDSFYEFRDCRCGFTDCTHNKEKKCGVKEGVDTGLIKQSRYENYLRFLGEVYESNSKLYK
ncbi:MAG: ribosome small subunit-dependent GTPase A [Bacilli bacterium]|nr:ribosome small subunit-dependent GTPase A [Bacilli bacterium]